jgi:signal transduction histidine kinase/ligand-binding sensor domain-containing protein/DNA-binding response OmpR family regulator
MVKTIMVMMRLVHAVVFYIILSPMTAQSPVTFERYSTLQGLPQNSIFSIAQDASGFIWLATYNGLSRFDGSEFLAYQPDHGNPGGISSNITVTLVADALHHLWIGTTGSGLAKFDTRTLLFENYQSGIGKMSLLAGNDVNAILPLQKAIWVGTSAGLSILNHDDSRFINFSSDDGLRGNYVLSLLHNGGGEVWVSTSNGVQLVSMDEGGLTEKAVLLSAQTGGMVLSLYRDSEGRLWTVSAREVACFEYQKDSLVKTRSFSDASPSSAIPEDTYFTIICERAPGEFWVGTQNGLLRLLEKNDDLVVDGFFVNHLYDDKSLPGNHIISLLADSEGVLWIGTRYNGLAKYDPYKQPVVRYMQTPGSQNTLHSNDIRSVSEDEEGHIWVGSRNQGLDYIIQDSGEIKHFDADSEQEGSLPDNGVRVLYLDKQDVLWVGYSGGFAQIKVNNKNEAAFQPAMDENGQTFSFSGTTYALFEDSKDRFWVGTTHGLILYDRKTGDAEWFRSRETQLPSGRQNFIRSICEDEQGHLWVATDGEGVCRFNPETKAMKSYRQEFGDSATLSHNKVYAVFKDKEGHIWLGTHSGLNKYSPQTDGFFHFTQEDGLSNNIVYGIMQDQRGFLWLSTANGLSRFDPSSAAFKIFLSGFEFSDDAFSMNKEGKIYVGGLNGFFAFHPDSLRENHFVPPVRFTRLRLNNQIVEPGEVINDRVLLPVSLAHLDELVLQHDENFFSIEFAALSYASPLQNRYQFRLDGLHTQWMEASHAERVAVFTSLAPGRYVLHVRGANADGVWGASSLPIYIRPAFYQTAWFKSLMVLIFTGIIFLLYRLRLRSVTRQKIRLQKTVDEKTDVLQKQNRLLAEQRDEIERQSNQVIEMTRMVHEADERKLRFFTGISHEIRTPLTLILGPLEQIIEKKQFPAPLGPSLERIHRNAQGLLKLVSQLLDFRKIDSGLMPLEPSRGHISQFIHEQVELYVELFNEKQIAVKVDASNETPRCYFDHDLVAKVFSNMLTNAIKYSPANGQISVSLKTAHEQDMCVIQLRVTDSGSGIPEGEQSRIFERFYRSIEARKHQEKGSGIGLAFSRELARLHGGDLLLEHAGENGSTFLFHFPLQEDLNSEMAAVGSSTANELMVSRADQDTLKGHAFTILVIEDNPDLRGFIREGLGHFNVLEAADGEQGLLMAEEHVPDLIISDVLMPGKNGFELCRIIKSEEATSHIPVLLLTALGAVEHQKAGVHCGADDYMVKPFNLNILIGKVSNILTARARYREMLLKGVSEPAEAGRVVKNMFVEQAEQFILRHLAQTGFGVEELGRSLHMSRSTLYRKISSFTGVSPVEFIRRVRLRKSCELLQQRPDLSIGEVALMVGFEDVDYYRQCFKKVYDVTPSEYTK